MDPPQCVQNAMMTKDKKPFTYTPGGIDLSEVRSPRMARRIERNANLGGAGDIPKPQPPPPQNTGSLPPSVQAVMRPQPQVQVFPSGPPPPPPTSRGGAPPPPPPMNAPPPPPPPSGPLPTQKVMTSDNQVLERPDMTKIIPDNPMALLRKTGGPQPRRSLVDEMFAQEGKAVPAPTTPPGQQRSPQYEQQQRYQPPVERGAPISPVPQQYQPQPQPQYQPPKQQYQPPPLQQQYQSPPQQQYQSPPQQQYQPPSPPHYQQQQQYQPAQQRSPEAVKEQPRYQPPVIERQPTIPRQNNGQPEVKTSTAHLGSLYIPPANQQQQRRVVSPPSPPERNQDSPNIQTPPLREAPRPWQAKKVQQEEIPPWAKKENNFPSERQETENVYKSQSPPASQQQPQQRWPQSRPVQQPQPTQQPQYNQQVSSGGPVRIVIRTNTGPAPYQQPREPEERQPEAVYITQPIVLQHPGPKVPPQQQQQWQKQNVPQPKVDNQGARVIPIQVEGANQGPRTPATPGNDRSLNCQQSWGSNPTQSNSFKIIQKLTHTDDDDDEDENVPVTEHAPRYPQNFQQPPADQVRRMKLSEGDQNLMNKFKQVPAGPQPQRNKGPQVRTIPVQIEGDDSPQPYVHPSEQVVPEPKKYTGSAIPSRSFKILQAMTAPDSCANVDEQYEAYPYEQWGFDPNYPHYPPPPYWHEYYYNYYYPEPQTGLSNEESTDTSSRTTPRQTPTPRATPVPFWNYMPPYSYPVPRRPTTTDGESDTETATNLRFTPLHIWGEEAQSYPQYPPYFDPYYYSYYYGYPPMYPPYPYYGDTEDFAGYSSTDEMSFYNKRSPEKSGRRSSLGHARPLVTPTLNIKEKVVNSEPEVETPEPEENSTESESDTETEEVDNNRDKVNSPLKSIKSVNNIHVYADEEDTSYVSSDDEVYIEEYVDETSEDVDEENSYIVDGEGYPHQLSVIFEESERTESRIGTASALSDSTTIAERSDDEEDQSPNVTNKPFKFCVSVTEENKDEAKTTINVGEREIKTFEESDRIAVNSPSLEVLSDTLEQDNVGGGEDKHHHDDEEGKESDESEDWWGILGTEDDLPAPKPIILKRSSVEEENSNIKEESDIEIKEAPKKDIREEKLIYTLEKLEEEVAPKNNYAKATKSVYDKIEDQFEEEENSGKLIEMESFVARLEQIQKESGLWNIVLPGKNEDRNSPRLLRQVSARSGEDIKRKISEHQQSNKNTQNNSANDVYSTSNGKENVDFFKTIKTDKEEANTDVNNEDSSTSYSTYSSSKSSSEENEGKDEESVVDGSSSVKDEEIESMSDEVEEELDQNVPEIVYPNNQPIEAKYMAKEVIETEESSDDADSESEDEREEPPKENLNSVEDKEMQLMSIKERIEALKENIKQKQSKLQQQEAKMSVKEKISSIETTSQNRSKTTSTKSSVKSFEDYSEEEEGDSGVTSDMSRHISDTEEFPELKKLTKYQRAATHSRLFKLLQDECDNEEDEEEEEEAKNPVSETDKFSKLSVRKGNVAKEEPPRRDQLSLPLNKSIDTESLSSSGVNSPSSPVNDRLINELVQSLLKRKKGQMFRNMPKDKLYAAAAKILQEDLEGLETPSDDSSFLSPLRGSTGYSTAAQTPQEFNGNYDEYKQYYDTWSDAEKLYDENYDILPSKAFKLLQEHSNLSKTGTIAGLLAKCPRVLSSKNIHRKLMKLLESPDCPSPTPENPLESNEVTSPS